MNKRYKIMIIIIIPLVLFGAGITYSIFNSKTTLNSADKEIAKFIFNTEMLEELELPLFDLNPGDTKEYLFSVSNNNEGKKSGVTIEYQMIMKTYHLVPLNISLYKVGEEEEELIMTCDENYTRNDNNEIVCNSPVQELKFVSEIIDNYKLKVEFPDEYDGEEFSGLVDYIDIEIKSWQKI